MGRFKSVEELVNKLEELNLSKHKWTYNQDDLYREGMDRFIYINEYIRIVLVVRDWLSFTDYCDEEILNRCEDFNYMICYNHIDNNGYSRTYYLHNSDNNEFLNGHNYAEMYSTYKEFFEYVDKAIEPIIRKSKIENYLENA
jgi:hypothetical protein